MAIGRPVSLTSNVASKSISVTATENQTLFTVTGGYRINELAVFRNGARLVDGEDYTARDGATVTLLSGANLSDTLEFQVFDDFRVADAIVSADSNQTISGNLTVTGTLTGSALGITSAGTVVGTAKTLNFIGTGNTFLMNGDTVNISIAGGGGSGVAATITVADESSNATCFPVFVTAATGDLNPKSGSNLTFNSSNGTLTATTFSGALSGNATGLSGTPDITVGNIVGSALTVTGVLTYNDVTNVDSIGIITARAGIRVGAGQSISAVSGTLTYFGDGSNLTGISAGGITTTASSPSANTVVTLNLGTAQHHDLTLSAGITTITCTGGSFGETHSVVLTQPSSGIATVGFSTYFLFPSGSTPEMSEGTSKVDLISFVVKQVGAGGTQLLASAGLNFSN